MSEAGISNQPNCEDRSVPETTAVESEQTRDDSELTPPSDRTESRAVDRFEQRIASRDGSGSVNLERVPRLREADWFSLARKLRQRNRDLLKKVASLEQTLSETQEQLQAEIARSRSGDTLNAQQTKELQATQEKIGNLFGELETSHQAVQQQQALVEDLSQQLETSQHRIAELERECAFLQQRYEEQSHQLQATEQQARELSARLQRQQRRTLQFKAALDKCLEAPPREEDSPQSETKSPLHLVPPSSGATKAQPIQPWSSQFPLPEDREEPRPSWVDKTLSERLSPDPSPTPESDAESETSAEDASTFASWEDVEPIEWEPTPSESDPFDFVFDVVELPGDTSSPELASGEEDSSVPEIEEAVSTESKEIEEVSSDNVMEFPRSLALSESESSSSSNFPSPVVYPHRTQKKHKSLASIELPRFLR